MAVKVRADEVKRVLPQSVETGTGHQRTGDVASEHNGTIIKLESLPRLLNDPEFVKSIEGAASYQTDGYVRLQVDTSGTKLRGFYKMNSDGKTLDEMFTFISDSFDSNVEKVPFKDRVVFCKGGGLLPLIINSPAFDSRNKPTHGNSPAAAASEMVVEPPSASNQDKPAKAANGTVVPTDLFNAARKAFMAAEPTLRPDLPDLAAALRAVFGE